MADDQHALTIIPDAVHDLVAHRLPSVIIEDGRKAAKELHAIVEAAPNKLVLNGKQYLYFEHWQMLGRFHDVTAKIAETKYVEFAEVRGFEARAIALHNGLEISAAEAACLTDEPNWRGKPLFQLKSMAQTRAAAKALRTVLAWIVVLAGYEPTPAEEMSDPEKKTKKGSAPIAESGAPLLITKVDIGSKKTGASGKPYQRFTVWFSDGTKATTIKDLIGSLAQECWKQRIPIRAEIKATEWGPDLVKLERADLPDPQPDILTADDIPF
jgi:hypothetical protein